jgi:hypothetical protein
LGHILPKKLVAFLGSFVMMGIMAVFVAFGYTSTNSSMILMYLIIVWAFGFGLYSVEAFDFWLKALPQRGFSFIVA